MKIIIKVRAGQCQTTNAEVKVASDSTFLLITPCVHVLFLEEFFLFPLNGRVSSVTSLSAVCVTRLCKDHFITCSESPLKSWAFMLDISAFAQSSNSQSKYFRYL